MNPISKTAFYCCGVRMQDAEGRNPICGDQFAKIFMDQRGKEIFQLFGGQLAPNRGNAARHRYIDDYLRSKLASNPELRVILLGCGFDSRAYRLPGGVWIELDEPALIAYKNEKLSEDSCPNRLQRIAINFAEDSLAEKLSPFADGMPTVFIIEGVTMYLTEPALKNTLTAIRRLFGKHEIIADLMSRKFLKRYGKSINRIIASLGAEMIPMEDPARVFIQSGYQQQSCESVVLLLLKYRGFNPSSRVQRALHFCIPTGILGYSMRIFS